MTSTRKKLIKITHLPFDIGELYKYRHTEFSQVIFEAFGGKSYLINPHNFDIDIPIISGFFNKEFHFIWSNYFLFLTLHHPMELSIDDILKKSRLSIWCFAISPKEIEIEKNDLNNKLVIQPNGYRSAKVNPIK